MCGCVEDDWVGVGCSFEGDNCDGVAAAQTMRLYPREMCGWRQLMWAVNVGAQLVKNDKGARWASDHLLAPPAQPTRSHNTPTRTPTLLLCSHLIWASVCVCVFGGRYVGGCRHKERGVIG